MHYVQSRVHRSKMPVQRDLPELTAVRSHQDRERKYRIPITRSAVEDSLSCHVAPSVPGFNTQAVAPLEKNANSQCGDNAGSISIVLMSPFGLTVTVAWSAPTSPTYTSSTSVGNPFLSSLITVPGIRLVTTFTTFAGIYKNERCTISANKGEIRKRCDIEAGFRFPLTEIVIIWGSLRRDATLDGFCVLL